MKESIDELLDCQLFITSIQSITSNNTNQLIDSLTITKSINLQYDCKYSTRSNILNTLLVYTYPTTISLSSLINYAELLISKEIEESIDPQEYLNSLQPPISISDSTLIKTTQDLLIDINSQTQLLSFSFNESQSSNYNLLKFIQAKSLHLSKYYNHDLIPSLQSLYESALAIASDGKFRKWYQGIIQSYNYYWNHYGCVHPEASIEFHEYLRITYSKRFDIFIKPLEDPNNSISLDNWMKNVILPLIIYNNKDFTQLKQWLFQADLPGAKTKSYKYHIWFITFKSIINNSQVNYNDYKELVEYVLAGCYYYGFKEDLDKVSSSSIELIRIYDFIKDTLNLLPTPPSNITNEIPEINITDIPQDCQSLDEFINLSTNPLKPLFINPTENSINVLKNAILTIEKLFPVNKLTLAKYFKLKWTSSTSPIDIEKEILKIISNLSTSNYIQLLQLVKMFQSEFIPSQDRSNSINKIIIERLLFSNLFEIMIEFYQDTNIEINEFFKLIEDKFWDSFNHSSNLNEKIGYLNHAKQCLDIFDKLSLDPELNQENHQLIIRLKHLFKAIYNMKNFKIVIERNQPFTPQQLINRFTNRDDQGCLELVTLILEQNPKSYLAFEKLYKILNDLLLFSPSTNSATTNESHYYFNRLKSACIESALIDNNFSYAYSQTQELFNHYGQSQINELWLTFYQVGKYISPKWFEDEDNENIKRDRLDILYKQREILSKTLLLLSKKEAVDGKGEDNSKIILDQWGSINKQIEQLQESRQDRYTAGDGSPVVEREQVRHHDGREKMTRSQHQRQPTDKISNLLVSGLGWAIGANKR
ncbi:uncharacterized protein J8A68_001875 [[Candida] subhashii]|uniref:Sec39 domain-containing protein n=1 Tax=[Candida] subhashii TaxID=561895 RepID=A0A8J5UYT5_9ASCO|nr:uncharacterized protein J8A68_001875 [[Candida] subhashii]KAG7664580.1 hypothetical protein J8A68_001875 [[Candida] subhashii]